MLKQESRMKCVCGQNVTFPEGEVRTKCKTKGCGAKWECGIEGFWYVLAPSLAKSDSRAKKYHGLPKSKRKRRKAGSR